jgi:hypothetical protein
MASWTANQPEQGGWAEHLLTHPDPNTVFDKYLRKCKDLGSVSVSLCMSPV